MQRLIATRMTPIVAALAAVAVGSVVLSGVLLAGLGNQRERLTDLEARLGETEAGLAATSDRLDQVALGASLLLEQAEGLLEALDDAGPRLGTALDEAIAGLAAFEDSTISFPVDVDERVPVATSFPFRRTIDIPIDTSIPINEVIDTTIRIQGPLGVEIPIDVEVPVDLDVPVNLSVPFTVDETVDIETTIRVDLAFPVSISVADTELATFAARLRTGLEALRELATGIG